MKKNILVSFCVFLYINTLFSQSQKKDSLAIESLNKEFYSKVYSDINIGKSIYKKIFSISKQTNNPFGYAKAYNLKGITLDIEGKLDSAKICYNTAINYAKKSKTISTEASALNNIGLLFWNEGQLYKALLYFNKALVLFEKIERKDMQANVLSNIGLIYYDIDEAEKAKYYQEKGLTLRKEINDEYGLSVSYINLAILYNVLNFNDKSIDFFNKGIALKLKIDDKLGIAIAKNNFASVLVEVNRQEEAIKELQEAEKLCNDVNAESNIIGQTYMSLAQIYVKKKDLDKAMSYNQKFLNIIDKVHDKSRIKDYYNTQKEISILKNDYKNAYKYSIKRDSVNTIIEGVEVKKSINLFEAKYQFEKREKEILKAKARILESENLIKKKTTQFTILSIIAIGILIISYLVYRQQRLKNTQQKQEFELKSAIATVENQNKLQEQRLEISRDLHDNIGSQLTFIISSVDNIKYAFDLKNPKLENKLSNINDFAKSTIIELRDTIWAMNHNEISAQDLRLRINNFIEKAKGVKENVAFTFSLDDNLKERKFNSVEGMNIYRTIQEAINNSIKYANASQINVSFTKKNKEIEVVITDNGKGFDIEQTELGNGIKNMKKRISDINGTYNIESHHETGTKIRFTIP